MSLALLLTLLAVSPGLPTNAPSAQLQKSGSYQGRGIYYFEGRIRCPLAGLGTRGGNDCNRLALDDDNSQVTIDPSAHEIVFTNTKSYAKDTVVGDLLFMGTATTASGAKVPMGFHLKLHQGRSGIRAHLHAHPVVRDDIVGVDLEDYEVVAADGKRKTTVFNREEALKTARDPDLATRLASAFVTVDDNLIGTNRNRSQPGFKLADISIGIGRPGLSKKVLQAQISSLDGAPGTGPSNVSELFKSGAWEIRLTSLSHLLPKDILKRELFLYGLDGIPGIAEVQRNGLTKGESLAITFQQGRGTLTIGAATRPLPEALEVARAFLEFSFIGAILEHQAEQQLATAR
ncbi:MAG: hypothetical protein ACYCWW_00680 [Deltaproteobacteria bacterium]